AVFSRKVSLTSASIVIRTRPPAPLTKKRV
ncbi:MAG: hypothetical protein ACI9K2_004623, partial [Myxococcota bacterium]